MKKISVIAVSFILGLALLCSCSDKQFNRTYTFGDGVNSSQVTLNDDGSFTFVFSQLSSYIGLGKFSISGDKLTLETSDGKYHYVFRITDSGIEFDADASSNMLWFGEFVDGSIFE